MRVLILGGTGEARALAAELATRPEFAVVSSLAGRVTDPALPVGEVRLGGFGGVPGLVDYLHSASIEAVIDATHPFAITISAHAAQATVIVGCPIVVLRRPAWRAEAGDRWIAVPDVPTAASTLIELPEGCVFVTTGRRDLAAFAADERHTYLVRTVEHPSGALPRRVTLLLDRGPYTVEGESALLSKHGVIALVTKNSGGEMTRAKLIAARERGIPVVIVERPAPVAGLPVVATIDAAIAWLDNRAG